MIYYGSRISDNLSSSPEGFLICHNVPIARTGYQDYLGSEFPEGMQTEYKLDPNKIYKVYRSETEVFSAATIASFEGKPFTDNHPTEMVNTQNISMYGKGHIQNIQRGEGEYRNMLTADIICTDESVANLIKNSTKREVSCGYDYVIKKGAKGFEQSQIRGNHLALVESGRAGQKAAIQDNLPDAIIKQKKEGDTNKMPKKITKSFLTALGLKHYMQDAEPEELEQALGEMGTDEGLETNQGGSVEKDIADLKASLAQVVSTLQQLVKSDKEVHEGLTDEDKLKALETVSTDSDPDERAEKKEEQAKQLLIEAEKEEGTDESPEVVKAAMDAAMKEVIKVMSPILLSIPDEKARGKAVDAFVATVKDARSTKSQGNDYASLTKIISANAKAADKAVDKRKTTQDVLTEQVNTINKYNPHLKKEEK